MKSDYGRKFYDERHQKTIDSARAILSIALDVLPPVTSAVDFGCGVGTWLAVLQAGGAEQIQGLDGPWVEQDLLEIPRESFREVNFERPIPLEQRYDLAISLEVAEHLPAGAAETFVSSLTAASDFVLFSAAIPHQGGIGHVNEQWPAYWIDHFAQRGYRASNFVRRQVWTNPQVLPWYRQNVILFVRHERAPEVGIPHLGAPGHDEVLPLVLPEIYLPKAEQMRSVHGNFKSLLRSIRRGLGWKRGRS
ncbi:MAG: methyltransferase domain-containing protein [Acidobacteriota bacterium]